MTLSVVSHLCRGPHWLINGASPGGQRVKSRLLSTAAVIGSLVGLSGAAAAQTRPVQPVYNWTGCYVGAHAGYGWGETRLDSGGAFNTLSPVSAGTDGGLAGGQAGCDWQVTPNFVFGVEGMAAWADIHGASDPFFENKNVFSASTNWIASTTARAGFNAGAWLFYAKVGPAWSDNDYRVRGSFFIFDYDERGSDTRSGWTWGVGLEWAFAPNWSAKLEYNQYDFGRGSVRLSDRLSPDTTVVRTETDIRVVTVAFSYRFATGRP